MTSNVPSPAGSRVVLRGRVVTPSEIIEDGVVVVDGPEIAWVGPADGVADAGFGPAPAASAAAPDVSAPVVTLLPGLVDLHNHGGGGASFPDSATADGARVAVREHLRHGTTSLVASLVTASRPVLLQRVAILADLADAGEIAGIHLEGPFLSAVRCGAQNPADMLTGDATLVREIAAAARGHLRTMTVAPEVPGVVGASGVAETLVEVGALPSVGHTDASSEETDAAITGANRALAQHGARGRRITATHLFNGMRPLHHRAPGPIASCLAAAARGEIVVELIADGTHLAAGTVRSVFELVGSDAIALVTDAMAAAGMADGTYQLGPMAVTVADGVARLDDGTGEGSIAGGTYHLLDVVRETVAAGIPLVDAVRAASLTPAGVLGRTDVGALEAGRRADVVVTDGDLRVRRVLRAGQDVLDH
ncbi:N-acetylglucosamine-6-phosphate deacetylase [Oerskovia flava]|uniref:N-acetylglucosamine-6-phosphate deacetylase n=1 Tax=Oerskovia flava TaxID=2986422 RepID=UPI00223FBDF0|nr:amidohydrolase family protein [Oerskovia sp. JB1-3-2]